jgi:hypothetical protein
MLLALGGLALIAALAVAALSASTGPATRAAAILAQAEATRAAEAAVHRLIAAGADPEMRRALPADGRVISTNFYGAELDLSGQDAGGLIDVNTADETVLTRLLSLTGVTNAASIVELWREPRNRASQQGAFGQIGDALFLLSEEQQAQARPALDHLTVWSGRSTVDPFVATAPALAAAANIPLETAQAYVAARTLDGRSAPLPEGIDMTNLAVSEGTVIGLKVRATTESGGRAALSVVVRFTRSPRAPVTILSWQ